MRIELSIEPIAGQCNNQPVNAREAVGRALARLFPGGVVMLHTQAGAPYLQDRNDVAVSVSHSRRLAGVAVCHDGTPVGLDIEQPRPQLLRIASRFMSRHERLAYGSRLPLLTLVWSAKEAVYKAALTPGLALSDISVCLETNEAVLPDGRRFKLMQSWRDGHAIVIAVYIK